MSEINASELLKSLPENVSDVTHAWIERIPDHLAVVETSGSWTYRQLDAAVADTRAWQQQIPDSELLVLKGNSYHVAATHAAESAQAALDFIRRRG